MNVSRMTIIATDLSREHWKRMKESESIGNEEPHLNDCALCKRFNSMSGLRVYTHPVTGEKTDMLTPLERERYIRTSCSLVERVDMNARVVERCPISQESGALYCHQTPYMAAADAYEMWEDQPGEEFLARQFRMFAEKEYAYLSKLRKGMSQVVTFVRLLRDKTTPEHWVGNETKKKAGVYFKAGTIVRVIPADNMPADSEIKYWIDEASVEDNCYGVALYVGDFEVVEEQS